MEKNSRTLCIVSLAFFSLFFLVSCNSGDEGDDYYPSSEAQITSFRLLGLPAYGVIDESRNEIVIEVPSGTDVSYLIPLIEVSEGSEVYPDSGIAEDFTYPVYYTVFAEDGISSQDYLVTVIISDGSAQLFHDDFLGSIVNWEKWHIPTWVSPTDGTYVGRTQFRCTQNSSLPEAAYGNAFIILDTYNPTGASFYGTDLISDGYFWPDRGLLLTVRAKMDAPIPEGIVGGIFLYAPPSSSFNTLHDEITFELLTSDPYEIHTNIYGYEPLGTGNPDSCYYDYGSITDYHIYEIEWFLDQVSWYVDGNLIRTVTTQSPIPEGPMYVHLNMWAPGSDFADAYDPNLEYTTSPSLNETFSMSVDYVNIETVY